MEYCEGHLETKVHKTRFLVVQCFVCLRLYAPVNNFSVILGRLPGFNQYAAMGMKCLAQGHKTVLWNAKLSSGDG